MVFSCQRIEANKLSRAKTKIKRKSVSAVKILRQVGLYALLAVVFWAGTFGIAFGVVEWREKSLYLVTLKTSMVAPALG